MVYNYGYWMLLERTRLTEEEGEAREKVESIFKDMEFSEDTGLPAIAQRFGPADGSAGADFPEGF